MLGRRLARLALLGASLLGITALALVSGCSTLSYYTQAVGGHLAIVRAAKPVPEWLADAETPPALRARLELSQRIRDYAVTELNEPDNASYRRYADLHRSAAIWNVVAAPELSLRLKTWCFPVVGCVGYRGYYKQADADAFADSLRATGLEVRAYGVPAYSTLGKLPGEVFADPLLNTFIGYSDAELARLIFHELAHQIAFAKGDTVFNESFATAVERIGSARWLEANASPQARAAYALAEARRSDFAALTGRYRDAFNTLYESTATDADKRAGKQVLLARLQADYATLKRERWNGYAGYDDWFAQANNASFGVLAAYTELVPNFERLFEREGGDFNRFYAEVKRLSALPLAERRKLLP